MTGPARQASCPNCGGPIEFKLGSSAALVCPWCRFSVVRTDRDLRAIGKIADLVPTAPVMTVGDRGTIDGEPFVVGGRLQLDHGRGPWDEWYIELSGGKRWGWAAHAQGFWYLTFLTEGAQPPPWDHMEPGSQGQIPGGGDVLWTVAERGGSALLSAEGELPSPAIPGESGRYVDLSGPGGAFATIDYGDGTEPPQFYVGRQLPTEAVHWQEAAVGPRPTEHVDAARLRCPKCGGPVPIMAPDTTERAACPSCHALLDFEQGNLRYLKQLDQPKVEPLIPLGHQGKLFGLDCMVIGFMERCTVVDYVTYAWHEYLLHTPEGYRWLVEDCNHFTFLDPVSAGDIELRGDGAVYEGRTYVPFSKDTLATVRFVIGEFYWRVEVGEQARTADFIAPPYILSEESSETEVIWSHGRYVPIDEIWRAFGQQGKPPKPYDVAPAQPNPVKLGFPVGFAIVSLVLLAAVAFGMRNRTHPVQLVQGAVPMPDVPDPHIMSVARQRGLTMGAIRLTGHAPTGSPQRVTFTPTFVVPPKTKALEVDLSTNLGEGWVGLAAALIDQKSGEITQFTLEQDAFRASGPATRATPRLTRATIGRVSPGPHVLRLDPRWARRPGTTSSDTPPTATLSVQTTSGRRNGSNCCLCSGVLLILPALLSMLRKTGFEKRRWRNSNLA